MKIFTKKNFFIYCVTYFIVTIVLSIYNVITGQTGDSLGYFHELYRALFLLILLMLFYYIRHFSLKKKFLDSLAEMWPLLLALLGSLGLLYWNNRFDLATLKKYLLYGLLGVAGLVLLYLLINSLIKGIGDFAKGTKKLSFSFIGLLFVSIMLLPLLLMPSIMKWDDTILASFNEIHYIIAFIFLALACLGVLLVSNSKQVIKPLCIAFIALYYFAWVIVLLNELSETSLILLLIGFALPWVFYTVNNKLYYSLLFVFIYVIVTIALLGINP